MAIRYEMDFGKNEVTWRGARVERKFRNLTDIICHHFSLKNHVYEANSVVELVAGKIVKEEWLYGPATSLKTRSVIFPCSKHRCSLPCPCRLCRKIQPRCQLELCSGEECMLNFDDHSHFHSVFHLGCKWCGQMVQIVPHFNFHFVSREQRRLSVGKDDFNFRSGGFSFAAGRKISLELTESLLQDCGLDRFSA